MTETDSIRLRFDGSFPDGLTFVEAENEDGESINVGEWEQDGKYWMLEIDNGHE